MTSDTTDEPKLEVVEKPAKKKRGVKFPMQMAIREALHRQRVTRRIDYKTVAARHGVDQNYLKRCVYLLSIGDIQLDGHWDKPEEREIDARMRYEEKVLVLRDYDRFLTDLIRGTLFQCQEIAARGERVNLKEIGMVDAMSQMVMVQSLRRESERLYRSIMEEAGIEKIVMGRMAPPVQLPNGQGHSVKPVEGLSRETQMMQALAEEKAEA